uniref:Uncharacterized protein n=1 Tax=Acidobacterium capsulatum TaxID=33075 RepID=A0A7V5CTQ2_9BACT
MNTLTHSAVRGREQGAPRGTRANPWTPPVLQRTGFWRGISVKAERWLCGSIEAGREQVGPLLRKGWRIASRVWRQAAAGLQAWIKLRLPGAAVAVRTRQLAVEERLTLGPRQHLYLVRCGETRLLVGSAGEGALQWTVIPAGEAATDFAEIPRDFAHVKAPAPVAGKITPRRRAAPRSAATQEGAR